MERSARMAHGFHCSNAHDIRRSRLSMEGLAEPVEIHPDGTFDQHKRFGILRYIPDRASWRTRTPALAHAMRTDSTHGVGCDHHRRAVPRYAHDHRIVWMGIIVGEAALGGRTHGDAHEKYGVGDGCRIGCRHNGLVFLSSKCGTHRPVHSDCKTSLIIEEFLR